MRANRGSAKNSAQAGFSLVELMVSVVIALVLMIVLMQLLLGTMQTAPRLTCHACRKAAATPLRRWAGSFARQERAAILRRATLVCRRLRALGL
jgi:prepilin-type N-terminal cleavage/methylation domain-containing protein